MSHRFTGWLIAYVVTLVAIVFTVAMLVFGNAGSKSSIASPPLGDPIGSLRDTEMSGSSQTSMKQSPPSSGVQAGGGRDTPSLE
jgi:hypothetical protein